MELVKIITQSALRIFCQTEYCNLHDEFSVKQNIVQLWLFFSTPCICIIADEHYRYSDFLAVLPSCSLLDTAYARFLVDYIIECHNLYALKACVFFKFSSYQQVYCKVTLKVMHIRLTQMKCPFALVMVKL